MSNRKKPTRVVPLNAGQDPAQPVLVRGLAGAGWTDEPAADYSRQTLEWIAQQIPSIGRMNVWECEACGEEVLCYDLHPGTTPFMVSHHTLGKPECQGQCRSHFYSGLSAAVARERLGGPSHEWYRPSADELKRESAYVRDHVSKGGLLVREVTS